MYRKKRRSWTKHVDFMLLDVLCMQLAFVISYIIRFGTDNPYTDGDYRTLAIAFLFIDFFVEIVSDSFKNVLKRGYFDEFIATCRHVILVELIVTFYLFTTQTGSFYSRFSYYIMVPFYIVTDYAARVIWKKILQKTGFNSAKKSLLIIAPEKILRETLQIVSADRRGYAKVTAVSLDTDLKAFIKTYVKEAGFRFSVAFRLVNAGGVLKLFGIILWKLRNHQQIQILRKTKIGYGLYIGHGGPVIINPTAVIGNNCNLSQFVTIGAIDGNIFVKLIR